MTFGAWGGSWEWWERRREKEWGGMISPEKGLIASLVVVRRMILMIDQRSYFLFWGG